MIAPAQRIAALISVITTTSLTLAACSSPLPETETRMHSTTGSSADQAKTTWEETSTLAEATQSAVPGPWTAADSAAENCRDGEVRWALTRFGPPIDPARRAGTLEVIASVWTEAGYLPVRQAFGGDAPGTQLRYPAGGTLESGFFLVFRTTENGSTLQIQTPCTPGDADQLNREKYAEKHTNTPPNILGGSTATERATP